MERRSRSIHLLVLLTLLLGSSLLAGCDQNADAVTPPPPADFQATAEAYLRADDLDAAAQVWRETLKENPDDPAAHYQLALILLLDDTESAAIRLERIESLPEYADQVSRLRAALRQASVIDDHAYTLTIIGQALASVGEWRLAQIAFERAVEQNPDYAEAWAYLGEARQQNEEEDALEALLTAYALKPDAFAVNLFLSMYYRRTRGNPWPRWNIWRPPSNPTRRTRTCKPIWPRRW